MNSTQGKEQRRSAEPVASGWMKGGVMVNAFNHPPREGWDHDGYWAAKGYSKIPLYTTPPDAAAMAARIKELDAERDQWKANHDRMRDRCSMLRQRPDLPAERIPVYNKLVEAQERVRELEAYVLDAAQFLVLTFNAKQAGFESAMDAILTASLAAVPVAPVSAGTVEEEAARPKGREDS